MSDELTKAVTPLVRYMHAWISGMRAVDMPDDHLLGRSARPDGSDAVTLTFGDVRRASEALGLPMPKRPEPPQ